MYFIVNFWGKKHSNKSCVEDDEKIRGMVKFDGFKEKNLHMFSYSSVHYAAIIHQKYS